MPICDSLKLKAGEEVLLENSFMTSVSSEKVFKQFVVSQNVNLITTNKIAIIPVMQKQVNAYFEQMTWHDIDFSTSREPNTELKTIGGNFYIWYGDDIIIGSEEKAFVISEEELKGWGKKFIQN